MKGIGIGPAGGLSMSRTLGTKVTLAGRTAFLPNDDVPFVMQKLTMGQINAIPKDRYLGGVDRGANKNGDGRAWPWRKRK